MKYGRNQINKAGDILLTSSNQEEVNSVIEKINDWRMLHVTTQIPSTDEGNQRFCGMKSEAHQSLQGPIFGLAVLVGRLHD